MEVAGAVAKRAHCVRGRIGAVIIDDRNRIVATGYNGPPAGMPRHPALDCGSYCPRARVVTDPLGYSDCMSVHAEANALMFCDRRDREGGTIFVTGAMCFTCAKLVANSGLARVAMVVSVTDAHRRPDDVKAFLVNCGVEVITL